MTQKPLLNLFVNVNLFISIPIKSNYHGIVRTEIELLKFLTKYYPNQVQYFIYKHDSKLKNKYYCIPENEIVQKLNNFAKEIPSDTRFLKRFKDFLSKIISPKLVKSINDIFNAVFVALSSRSKPTQNLAPELAPLEFVKNATIISIGADFMYNDMLSSLINLKKQYNLKVIMMCYDLIPILFPTLCVDIIVNNFPHWLEKLSLVADKVACISENTKKDLDNYLKSNNLNIPELFVISLGDDAGINLKTKTNNIIHLPYIDQPFILLVSTIEPRKNHRLIVEVYKKLLQSSSNDLPHTLFIGSKGWKTENLIQEIENHKQLRQYIHILTNISDKELDTYYSKALFTIYPSLYEGWGLPIRESLMHGKFCLSSNTSSMPEAGGSFIEYIDPHNVEAWAQAIIKYSSNSELLKIKTENIQNKFQANSWEQFGKKIIALI